MPPLKAAPAKPLKTERTHEENQERAYIAASRRSDRSLEARMESARRASEIHKRRTGRSLRVTEEDVLNEEMYEELDDNYRIPPQYQHLTSHLVDWGNPDFRNRVSAYIHNQVAMRSALLDAAIHAQFSEAFPQQAAQFQPSAYTNPFGQQYVPNTITGGSNAGTLQMSPISQNLSPNQSRQASPRFFPSQFSAVSPATQYSSQQAPAIRPQEHNELITRSWQPAGAKGLLTTKAHLAGWMPSPVRRASAPSQDVLISSSAHQLSPASSSGTPQTTTSMSTSNPASLKRAADHSPERYSSRPSGPKRRHSDSPQLQTPATHTTMVRSPLSEVELREEEPEFIGSPLISDAAAAPTGSKLPMSWDLGPLTMELPTETQQLLGGTLDPADPLTAFLIPSGSQAAFQSFGTEQLLSGASKSILPPVNGLYATLAPETSTCEAANLGHNFAGMHTEDFGDYFDFEEGGLQFDDTPGASQEEKGREAKGSLAGELNYFTSDLEAH